MVMRNITVLKERERAKSEFLALVAHRLYEPMVRYRDKLKKLSTTLPAELSENHRVFFEKTTRFIDSLYNMVVKLLYFSELEAGPLRIERYRVDLNEMVDQVLERVLPMTVDRNITLEKQLPAKGPVISLDEERIHQVMYNLMVNAIKLSEAEKTIQVSLEDDVEQARFSVIAEGEELPVEDFSSIKKQFSADKDLMIESETEIGRSGLELAFIKHIIDAHGGQIQVEQQESKTIFSFSIPKIFF